MSNYNKCPNGHYYDASMDACPYCSSKSNSSSANQGGETGTYDDLKFGDKNHNGNETGTYGGFAGGSGEKDDNRTIPFNLEETGGAENMNGDQYEETVDINEVGKKKNKPENIKLDETERTVFFDEKEQVVNGQQAKVVTERTRRKLVGWLVTYSSDPMGVDYRLYEGKNIIGRDPRAQITIQDPAISTTHATIRYLKGKFAIKDEMSSHGTMVNGEDIELTAVYLNDGDLIQMGHTTLKFRTAI